MINLENIIERLREIMEDEETNYSIEESSEEEIMGM